MLLYISTTSKAIDHGVFEVCVRVTSLCGGNLYSGLVRAPELATWAIDAEKMHAEDVARCSEMF